MVDLRAIRVPRTSILVAFLLVMRSCIPEPSVAPAAASEAAFRFMLPDSPRAPWEVVCVTRNRGDQPGNGVAFHKRFVGHDPPVVGGADCLSDAEGAWRDREGRRALVMREATSRRRGGELVVEVDVSGGTADFSRYRCAVRRDGTGWRVRACELHSTT
jgi:hypothetical protein